MTLEINKYYAKRCREIKQKLDMLISTLENTESGTKKKKTIWDYADEIYSLMAEIQNQYRE